AALRGVALRLGDQLGVAVFRPAATAVRRDAVRDRSPHLVERHARSLAGDVPESDVEPRERVRRDALLPDAHVPAEPLLPQRLDPERILADERRREPRLQVREHGFGTAAAENEAVAQALHALVGPDLRDDELLVRVAPRHGLRRGNGEDEAVY